LLGDERIRGAHSGHKNGEAELLVDALRS